jgi:hypothetical protein
MPRLEKSVKRVDKIRSTSYVYLGAMLSFLSVVLYCKVYEPGLMGGGREATGAGDRRLLRPDSARTVLIRYNRTVADCESLEVCYDNCGFDHLYAP